MSRSESGRRSARRPAQGRRRRFPAAAFRPASFNPRPRRRRRPAVAPLRPRQSFNPRPRTGGDHAGGFRSRSRQLVSIDAPRAGGDALRRDHASVVSCFKPRPRAGGDEAIDCPTCDGSGFQSTPPRRGRLRLLKYLILKEPKSRIREPTPGCPGWSGRTPRKDAQSFRAQRVRGSANLCWRELLARGSRATRFRQAISGPSRSRTVLMP